MQKEEAQPVLRSAKRPPESKSPEDSRKSGSKSGDDEPAWHGYMFPEPKSPLGSPLYLLEEPWLENWLFILSELGQLILLSFMHTDKSSVVGRQWWSLVWGGSVLLAEVEQAVTQGAVYFRNVLHFYQLLGLVLVLTATSMDVFMQDDSNSADSLMSIGLLLLWLQQLKLLYKFKAMGVLVRSMYTAFSDVFKWLILQSIVLFAFGTAFFALFRDESAATAECGLSLKSLVNQETTEDMSIFERLYINSQGFFYFPKLLEVAAGGSVEPTCYMDSSFGSTVSPQQRMRSSPLKTDRILAIPRAGDRPSNDVRLRRRQRDPAYEHAHRDDE